jgi:hypothetical protein
MSTPTSGSAAAGSSSFGTSTDIKAPLWDHVLVTERSLAGGNTRWKCKYCNFIGFSSYTRVEAHLLQIKGRGIAPCPKVAFEMLSEMRNEVERCKELVKRKQKLYLCLQPHLNVMTAVARRTREDLDEPELQSVSFGDVDIEIVDDA